MSGPTPLRETQPCIDCGEPQEYTTCVHCVAEVDDAITDELTGEAEERRQVAKRRLYRDEL